ncbi:MAG: hypothetical protein ACLFST_15190 [Spirochaetia bacterium]
MLREDTLINNTFQDVDQHRTLTVFISHGVKLTRISFPFTETEAAEFALVTM